MIVDLRRLHHLVALAEECHFARAAERVHLSQPAFSRSIQLLESQVGMRLFDRETGDVKPTPAGTFLIGRARRLLFDARSLERDTELFRGHELGDTAFGAGPFPAATIMPRVMTLLREQHPRVNLRLETNNWHLLRDRLLAEDIEFFVADVRNLPPDSKIRVTSIGRQPGHLFVRAGHPLARRTCTFAQAWDHGLAATKIPGAVQQLIGKLIGLDPADVPVPAVECDDLSLLRHLALTTDTVVAMADAACRADVESGRLVRLRVKDLPEVYSEMGIVELVDRSASPMAQRAIECVKQVAREVNVPARKAKSGARHVGFAASKLRPRPTGAQRE
jgi:DNA-binding transcriptional LysR family regulator